MVLARSKTFRLKVHIIVFVMIMMLMQTKYLCKGIGFRQQNLVFCLMEKTSQKDLHQTTLHDG